MGMDGNDGGPSSSRKPPATFASSAGGTHAGVADDKTMIPSVLRKLQKWGVSVEWRDDAFS